MIIFNKYCCVKQHDEKDCGVAALVTVAKHYGLKISLSKVREIAGTDKNGTSAYGLVKAAESLGFAAKGVKINTKKDILKEFPKPAIAHVVKDNSFLHYVVIHKVSENNIIVADPADGLIKYSLEEFFKIWTGVLILLVPTSSFRQGNETKGLFKKLIGIIKSQRKILVNVFISSILVTFLGVIGSFYPKMLLDSIIPNNIKSSLSIISISMILLSVFKIIVDFFRSLLMAYMSRNIDILVMLGYYEHVIKLPINFFSSRKVGEIISRFNDASKIREGISSTALTLMVDLIMAIFGACILYKQSSKLFMICFVPIIFYLILVCTFKKSIEKTNRNVMRNNSALTSYLVESIEGVETIKAFNGERKVGFEVEKRFIRFIRAVFKHGVVNIIQGSLKGSVKGIFGIAILWVGAYLTIKGEITIGTLIAFNSLLAYFIEPIERVIDLQPKVQSALVAADRLGEILELEVEKLVDEDKKINPETLFGDIEFQNVNFRYGMSRLVLKDINMYIKAGERIALVGESGSGKTTIAKLLMEFYDVEKGKVMLCSNNIKDINKEVLRDKISYISQDSFFFSGTIRENLQFVNKDVEYNEIIDSCKKAQLHNYINSLPERYDTLLEENASNLSGGQRQRLAIARALLKKPDILIMDEATSNLDTITEKAIENTIEEFSKSVTTIIIAHRLSTIMKCDRIYVMEKGKIIEIGNHKELIKNKGYYYRLWNGQVTGKIDKAVAVKV